MFKSRITIILVALSFIACSCRKNPPITTNAPYEKVSPEFNSDSAYNYIDKQVGFGYRVPNTEAHVKCGDYLVTQLKRFGAEVIEQKMVLTAWDGTKLNSRNIIASYNTDKKNRILLFAHWDTRPYSDQDPDPNNHKKPLLGANDGGSGVGVLLEIARVLQTKSPEVGVDIILFDSEDYGPPTFEKNHPEGDWWCLGSQYWAKNPHIANYKAKYGILLDIVGAPNAVFAKEAYSMMKASDIVQKVWRTASELKYGVHFVDKDGGGVTDDHVPVNEIRKVKSIDIIHLDNTTSHGFPSFWHTQKDDMSNISRETLKAVGQTVLEVIYKEK